MCARSTTLRCGISALRHTSQKAPHFRATAHLPNQLTWFSFPTQASSALPVCAPNRPRCSCVAVLMLLGADRRQRWRYPKGSGSARSDAIRKTQDELQWIVAQRLLSALTTPGLNLSRLQKSYHFRHPKLH